MFKISVPGRTRTSVRATLLTALLCLPALSSAQVVVLDKDESLDEKRSGWLPYIFSTDSLDLSVGVGGGQGGFIQPQASWFATGFVTANESALLSGALNNLRLGESRFFTDLWVLADHFTDQRFYGDLDNDPSEARAGSNDSDSEDFITGISDELTFNWTLKYPLAIGASRNDALSIYTTDEGMLQSAPTGGKTWNPLTSGRTTLATRFFYTYRDVSDYEVDSEQLEAKTSGLDFWIEYDNTDFPRNPSYGSRQQLMISSDFGWFDSSNTWTNIQFDASKYYNLGTSGWFKQQVLALDFWTSNTTSWETDDNNPQIISHRPPPSYGTELGGIDRMRAYPTGRFRDKAAAYYSAELRLMPHFQKMRDWPIINYFEVDWFQLVPFVEVGRVGPEFDADLFTKDLKVDAGLSLRAMAFRQVFRLDFAASEEGSSITAMISHPFSRPGS